MMYAGGVRGESLFPYYFSLQIVRRRLSRLNKATRPGKFVGYCQRHWSQLAQHTVNKRTGSYTTDVSLHGNTGNKRLHVRMGSVIIQQFRRSFGSRWCVGA
ncbi:uncharacterized protein TM35_000381750 [Trypanosoma theileri]|uniref:Uncharacterized protein n=1 Tax=Trypanosoma theileri TaxID=67003 RepID=A0A1X0NLW1_9TRYP|nr:uncharacterized protein TM35_000381750 [Trypanosoma theileri]ORC85100.1 hypothetical protein TM35_000381750 [Trypanosoma theileri]